ncbi:MAG: hypothetical protein EBX21_03480 [Proteobacteria bacterium]|nr:hypothetical protein [Pseudomonadota bacterium]
MKKYLLCGLVFLSSGYIYADGHSSAEASKKHENNFAYLSTYTIPAGSNPATLEKSLLRNVQDLKDEGYNNCGLLRHAFGGDRAFYSYCYFDSWEQFAEINDNVTNADVRQLYGDHEDRLVAVDEKNLGPSKYLVMATYSFGPYLTMAERGERAKILFDIYDEGFGGCNMMSHVWGPGLEWQIVCGFDSYADFAKKNAALAPLIEPITTQKLDILSHSDDIMVRVQ